MEMMEKVERLREKAEVTYEEAKAALEQTDGDLLDAMVLLDPAKVEENLPDPKDVVFYAVTMEARKGDDAYNREDRMILNLFRNSRAVRND